MAPMDLGFELGLNSWFIDAGGNSNLPDFTFEPETETLVSAFTTAPTNRRKKTINWAIKTLKGNNYRNAAPWSKIVGFWKIGNDIQSSLINWKNPGTYNLTVVGSPTINVNQDISTTSGAALNTNISLNSLDTSKMGLFVHSTGTTTSSSSDLGALNSDGSGLAISILNSAAATMTPRCGGPLVSPIGSSVYWNTQGVVGVSRQSNTSFTSYRGGVSVNTVTQNANTMGTTKIYLAGLNNNGTITSAPRSQTCWAVLNGSLTDDEALVLGNVMYELDAQFRYGELDDYPSGVSPTTVNCDLLVYGGTAAAITAAYEAKRQGLNVVILGGWRDSQVGGMPASGLGLTDWTTPSTIQGLPRWMLTQLQSLEGTSNTNFNFAPRYFRAVSQMMLDPRTSYGKDVPVYWSNGIYSITSSNNRVNSIKTVDGRTFNFSYWIDTSYEGDLLLKSGIPVTIGREANTVYNETHAGYVGTNQSNGFVDGTPYNHSGNDVNIDPYVISGNSASGLLSSVQEDYIINTQPKLHSGDDNIQSYNFRLTLTTSPAWRVPFPSTPRSGYSNTAFEGLGRLFASDSTMTFSDIFKTDAVDGGTIYDVNNKNAFSTDLTGKSKTYPSSSRSNRELIWKSHWDYILDLFYYLQYDGDPRIPSGVRTTALTWGFESRHNNRPNPKDDFQTPPQLYVRESYRMLNNFMLRESDMTQIDGTSPRSANTIGTVSYMIDSHTVQGIAVANGSNNIIYNEGILGIGAGGSDSTTPIPFEAIVPNKSNCENGLIISSIGASRVAYCGYRLELAMMQAGQSAAIAVKLAANTGNIAIQDVTYSNLRSAILSANTLTGETSAYIPILN